MHCLVLMDVSKQQSSLCGRSFESLPTVWKDTPVCASKRDKVFFGILPMLCSVSSNFSAIALRYVQYPSGTTNYCIIHLIAISLPGNFHLKVRYRMMCFRMIGLRTRRPNTAGLILNARLLLGQRSSLLWDLWLSERALRSCLCYSAWHLQAYSQRPKLKIIFVCVHVCVCVVCVCVHVCVRYVCVCVCGCGMCVSVNSVMYFLMNKDPWQICYIIF